MFNSSGYENREMWLESGRIFKVDLTGLLDDGNVGPVGEEVHVTPVLMFGRCK